MYDDRVKVLKSKLHDNENIKQLATKVKGNKAIDHLNQYGLFFHCMEKDIGIKTLANLNE
mgnify:CR=1